MRHTGQGVNQSPDLQRCSCSPHDDASRPQDCRRSSREPGPAIPQPKTITRPDVMLCFRQTRPRCIAFRSQTTTRQHTGLCGERREEPDWDAMSCLRIDPSTWDNSIGVGIPSKSGVGRRHHRDRARRDSNSNVLPSARRAWQLLPWHQYVRADEP